MGNLCFSVSSKVRENSLSKRDVDSLSYLRLLEEQSYSEEEDVPNLDRAREPSHSERRVSSSGEEDVPDSRRAHSETRVTNSESQEGDDLEGTSVTSDHRKTSPKHDTKEVIGTNVKEDDAREEPPESLFMKELRRRGMTPASLLEEEERIENGANDVRGKEVEKSLANQRERSMQLNSEGLEGLIPRGKTLADTWRTFFLAFWPFIVISVALLSALYLYFGPTFIHDANNRLPISPPQ